MEKKKRFKKSILVSVLIPMIVVLLMQSVLFVTAIYAGGTVETLKESSMNLLSELARSRSQYLENEMTSNWMSLSYPYENLVASVDGLLSQEGKTYADLAEVVRRADETDAALEERLAEAARLNTAVMNAVTPNLIDTIRISSVTGVFVALGTDSPERKYGLYIRDEKPDEILPNNLDLVVEVAPKQYDLNAYSLGRSDYLQTKFAFEEGKRDFFTKPYQAYGTHSEIAPQYLGWWSPPYYFNNETFRVMTYSVPLVSPAGECYGVMGIDVIESLIADLLPGGELISGNDGVYILGRMTEEGKPYDGFVVGDSVNMFGGFVSEETTVSSTEVENVYRLRYGKQSRYVALYSLKLYSDKTPFVGEQWQVGAYVYDDFVTAEGFRLQQLIFLILGISLLLGVGFICFAAVMIVRPIMRLTEEVRDARTPDVLRFEPIGITEIDNLTHAIEQLAQKVLSAQENLSKVIELSHMQIAVFEYDTESGDLYTSPNFAKLVNCDRVESYDTKGFFALLARMEKDCVSVTENVNIYKYVDLDGSNRWLEVRFVRDDAVPTHRLGVVADITDDYREKEQLRRELNYDPLTGIYNRRAFGNELDQLFVNRDFASAAFVMLDIDNLKFINDTYGHDFGDRYIRAAAEIIVETLRDVPNKLYGRRSGDEFYVMIYGNESATKIRGYVNRLRIAFKNSSFVCPDGEVIKIRISGGVSMYPDDATESGDMIKFADYAMYETKTSLKGEFRYFDRKTYDKNSYLLNNKEILYQLIENEDLDYYFQPIVRLRDGEVFAYEALMRPHSKIFSGPEDALRMAKVHYKLDRIERLTIFKTTQIFAERYKEFRGAKLFVNSLPNKALTDEDWELLKQVFGLDILRQCVIEITEDEQSNEEVMKRKIRQIREEGAQYALDDYGKGYNGEAQLLNSRPDYIKLDLSLVRGVDTDRDRQRIVGDLVSFAHSKRILVIAEGIETESEMEEIIRLDCDFAQGFWLAKPLPDPLDIPCEKKDTVRRLYEKYRRS